MVDCMEELLDADKSLQGRHCDPWEGIRKEYTSLVGHPREEKLRKSDSAY